MSSIDRDTTVAALAGALGVRRLGTESGALAEHRRLASIDDLRIGARLDEPTTSTSAQETTDSSWSRGRSAVLDVACVAGPACSTWKPLSPGRSFVGRAPHADLVIDDPSVELHHALLDVDTDDDGAPVVTFTQLAGPIPARLDGEPVVGATVIPPGCSLQIGATTLVVRPRADRASSDADATGAIATHVSDPWRRVVWRSPIEVAKWSADAIEVPVRPDEPAGPAPTALVGAAVAAAGAVVVATVMENAMFLVFAGVGATAALVTWLVSAMVAFRRRRRLRAGYRDAVAGFRSVLEQSRTRRRAHHLARHRFVGDALELCESLTGAVWSTRVAPIDGNGEAAPSDARFESELSATVGTGTARWQPIIEDPGEAVESDLELTAAIESAGRLAEASAPMSIANGDAIAFHGAIGHGRALARSIVLQLAARVGPADWRLVVVTARPDEWDWADWLPHGAIRTRAVTIVDGTERLAVDLDAIDSERRTLVVTDAPNLFTARTGPLRRYLAGSGAASIVLVDTDEVVPSTCRRVLRIGTTGTATWVGDVPAADDAVDIAICGITRSAADAAARRLACLVDPEDDDAGGGSIPGSVSFAQLSGAGASLTAHDVVQRWRSNGNDPAPRAALGWSSDGVVDIDLVRDGPHGLIAGTTGSGKSELLRSLVLSLAVEVGPEHLNVVLVDYKGGSTFDACIDLPHTVGMVTDLDDGLAERALVSLGAELHRRERMLRTVGATDLADYRSRPDVEPIARLLVVIDEFAALAKELPEFLAALVGIAQRGRSLGVHLLLATQRPAGVVNDDIRANTNLRLALRLHDRADAVDVVGDVLPSTFARGLPGRAALRLGPDELVVFQAARCTGEAPTNARRTITIERRPRATVCEPDDDVLDLVPARREPPPSDDSTPEGPSELDVTVRAIVDASQMLGLPPAHRPWLEPLPFPLSPSMVECLEDGRADGDRCAAIGVVDVPESQCHRALRWQPEDGSLALIGSLGSGTTSTLISLAAATCGSRDPSAVHLYVIDARGDEGLAALGALAHCGGVVRVTEDERLHRLLTRIVATIDHRLAGIEADADHAASIVLMIDGWSGLRASVAAVERAAMNELLLRVVNDGPAVGVVTVVTDTGISASSASLAMGERWVFHLDDPSLARNFGVKVPVGAGRPGRLRTASTGLEAQVAVGAAGLAEIAAHDTDASGPTPITVLPDRVATPKTPDPIWMSKRTPTGLELVIGVDSGTLTTDRFVVQAGDPIVIVGSPRTGVTTTLERCAAAWVDACGGEVIRVDRNNPLDSAAIVAAVSPMLVVVDDAHRVSDNEAGSFAAIVRGDHPLVTLLVGARADAVRADYSHWARNAAKARCGIVMSSRGDPDGDVLGVTVPRRPLIPARPGLGWVVDGGVLRQVQVAVAR